MAAIFILAVVYLSWKRCQSDDKTSEPGKASKARPPNRRGSGSQRSLDEVETGFSHTNPAHTDSPGAVNAKQSLEYYAAGGTRKPGTGARGPSGRRQPSKLRGTDSDRGALPPVRSSTSKSRR